MRFPSPYRIFVRSIHAMAVAGLLACATAFTVPAAHAQDHIVSTQDMQQQVQSQAATRQQNIETVTNFLSTPLADQAMQSKHFDPVKVRTAIPTLSDSELADLASRARTAQDQFAAGGLGHGLMVLIIIAIVVIIVVSIWH